MSPSHDILKPFYFMQSGVSTGGAEVYKVQNRKTHEWRIAWHLDGASRWYLSPAMSENLATTMMSIARDDSHRGSTFPTLRHRLKIYAKEAMPSRWKSHRKRMELRKEEREMANLTNFGMF